MAACATVFTPADQKLLDGLKASNAEEVEAALAQGAQANIEYADGMRPLSVAVARNDHASAEVLLRAGADPNVKVDVAGTPQPASLLSMAEDGDMAAILVRGGADTNRKDASGETPLGRAVLDGNVQLAKALLQAGGNAESPLVDGQTPLSFAVSTDNTAMIMALLEGGADPNREVEGGRTVLHGAAMLPSGIAVSLLLNKGASVNWRDHQGATPLMLAAREGYVGSVRALLEGDADANIRDSSGFTALDLANAQDHKQVAELLQEGGGTATRDAAAAREELASRQRSAAGSDTLRIFTTSITTDGRHLKIRGRVENPHSEPVHGIRYRVSLMHRASGRVLDSFIEERDDTQLAPHESIALRLDIASMYAANEGVFRVEALPLHLGEREIPEPPQWK
jgi:ankyrin repeat protein